MLKPENINAENFMALSYTYDFQGNVKGWVNNGETRNYAYDGLDRMISEEKEGSEVYSCTYSYDKLGNRTALAKGGKGNTTYVYNSVKKMELDSYTDEEGITWFFDYDLNGNMISKRNGETVWDFEYNAKNQLVKVLRNDEVIGEYEYDPNGMRIRKTGDGKVTHYIYSGESILYEETYDMNTGDCAKREYNIVLSGMNFAKFEWDEVNDWQLHYHLLDHLGSRQVVCDANEVIAGDTRSDMRYGTFGEYEGGLESEYSFTGKQRDSATELSYFNARFYDPVIGRFITVDPKKDGINWYTYCANNPADKANLFVESLPLPELTAQIDKYNLTVHIDKYATKQEIFNAFENPEAMLIFISGHGSERYSEIFDAKANNIEPKDFANLNISKNLAVVIFAVCNQGKSKYASQWKSALNISKFIGFDKLINGIETWDYMMTDFMENIIYIYELENGFRIEIIFLYYYQQPHPDYSVPSKPPNHDF